MIKINEAKDDGDMKSYAQLKITSKSKNVGFYKVVGNVEALAKAGNSSTTVQLLTDAQ